MEAVFPTRGPGAASKPEVGDIDRTLGYPLAQGGHCVWIGEKAAYAFQGSKDTYQTK